MLTTSDILDEAQLQRFETEGYLLLDGLFDPAEIDAMERFFDDFKETETKVFGGKTFGEINRKKVQVRAMHPHRHAQKPLDWALNPRVMAVLEALFRGPALLAQTMYYYKPPGTCGQSMHQDDFYLLTQPHHCLAAWTAIDDADHENGCLYVVPGSQHEGMRCPEGASPENHFKHGALSLAESTRKAVPLPVKRGQTLFFGGALIHGSSANRTENRWRRTFIGHYCDGVTESISRFYHPVIDAEGRTVSRIAEANGGGPCDGWDGAVH